MDKTVLALTCAGVAVLMAVSAFAGYQYADRQALERWTEYQAKLAEQTLKAEQAINEQETEYEAKLDKAQRQGKEAADTIRRSYELKLADSRVRTGSESAAGDLQVSSAPSGSSGDANCRCECTGQDRGRFQRLYEQQLEIARDCDIQITYCKRFMDFYRGLTE